MATKVSSSPIVLNFLNKDNYKEWSVKVKTYLKRQDLWDIIEATTEPPKIEDDEVAFKAWSKKNAMALHVIQISCKTDTFDGIMGITFAKIAWDTLAKKYTPKDPIVNKLLCKDNYKHWSEQVKTYLKGQDLWDIIEATIEHPKLENDEVAFKAWIKKNDMSLYAIQNSCEPDTFDAIREITSAKIAWDTLAENYTPKEGKSEKGDQEIEEEREEEGKKREKPRKKGSEGKKSKEKEKKKSQIFSKTLGTENNLNDNDHQYVQLRNAIVSGKWEAVKEELDKNPCALTAKPKFWARPALHIAVDFGRENIVKELVGLLSEQDLKIQDRKGRTALATATFRGSVQMAKCMLEKNINLISILDEKDKVLPVVTAITYGHIKLARYLYHLTPPKDLKSEKGISGATLITQSIYSRNFDIALDLLQRYPALALAPDKEKCSPLYALACTPYSFPSGYRFAFWKLWISSGEQCRDWWSQIRCRWWGINTQSGRATIENRKDVQKLEKQQSFQNVRSDEIRMDIQKLEKEESVQNSRSGKFHFHLAVLALFHRLVSNTSKLLGISQIYEMKSIHGQYCELLRIMREQISISNYKQRGIGRVYEAIPRAIKEGNYEFFYEVVKDNPDFLLVKMKENKRIFTYTVQYRQAKIFSLIYGLNERIIMVLNQDKFHNNILHVAGTSTDSTQSNRIVGAALQMQRELQWFKEVESIVIPRVKETLNKEGLTPRELFTRDHKDLLKKGEQWMKGTATSCTVVGALILTVMFAAAFAVPGGNDQNTGFPMFLKQKLFKLFILSDALSLFSSSTSVLMFLGILTSRYAEEDFLKSLPTKMIIGLSTLFFSIATMMTAFSAGLLLMVRESWMVIPVICLASVPVTLFVLMQFPLLVDMSISTYGPGNFDRKMKPWP